MKNRKIIALMTALVFLFGGFTSAFCGTDGESLTPRADSLSLNQIYDLVKNEVSGARAFDYVAYPYLGWRTNGGPWFNSVLDFIQTELAREGYQEGETQSGDKYWIQNDVVEGGVWNPQYASLEIIGPEGDDNFDFTLDTFDPTGDYYPDDITHAWVLANVGSEKETNINERCHLARRSGFSDPTGTKVADAVGITAEVVYVGQVIYDEAAEKYTWTENTGADLSGKIIFATNSIYRAYVLAVQEGAAVSLCSQINAYNNPVINGEALFPNTVKYAGVPNYDPEPAAPPAFNLSPRDEEYLVSLLENAQEPVMMKAVAIGDYQAYSEERPLKTLITEIKGATKPDERVVFVAHVQEPGACDNASGVGLQLELAITYKRLIDAGLLPRPARTMMFLWGAEYTCTFLWRDKYPDQMLNVKAALILDMVGENPEITGGSMRIEKSPDPSAVYNYGLDTLPGEQEPEATDAFVRSPDKHSLWGAGELAFSPYPGNYLNDLYFESAMLVSNGFPSFEVGSNPWEGGSDHDPFLWHTENFADEDAEGYDPVWNPIPALLTWHFTDYVYHTSMDTLDKVSRDELQNVGITTTGVGFMIANGDEYEASEIMGIVTERAGTRFGWERENSDGHLKWAKNKAVSEGKTDSETNVSLETALAEELEILDAWGRWYREAVLSSRDLCGAELSDAYSTLETANLGKVDELLAGARENARQIADDIKIKTEPEPEERKTEDDCFVDTASGGNSMNVSFLMLLLGATLIAFFFSKSGRIDSVRKGGGCQ